MDRYLFNNTDRRAEQRFSSLESLFDDWTTLHLEATGIDSGWRCLEIGAGGGSIARWMMERAGPSGHVLATDLDTRYLEPLGQDAGPNLTVQQHNIVSDPLPEAAFDLIHERLVLIHVPERDAVLPKLVSALRPGGWLVLESFDEGLVDRRELLPDLDHIPNAVKLYAIQQQLLAERGADTRVGRRQFYQLRELGLEDVGAAGCTRIGSGGSAISTLLQANFAQIRVEAIGAGLATDDEYDRGLMELNDAAATFSLPMLITAWGRQPSQ